MKFLEKPFVAVIILLILSSYLFFFQPGNIALTDPDETFYAQTAKEMLNRGEWLTPYLYGKPQFEKPILFYWLVEASFKIFGANEFAARLPSAVFGTFGIIAIFSLGALIFNKRVGIFSALILATNIEYILLSRACVTDMVLSTFMLAGVLFFFHGYLKEKNYFYLLSSIAFAFATLTKGPIAIMLPGAILAVYLFLVKDWKAVKKIPKFKVVLVFLIVTTPWYLLMYRLHGKEFVDAFFGFHNVTRFLESEHEIGSQFYYNIPIVFGGFFPWSVFVPVGLWHVFRKAYSLQLTAYSERRHSVFILLWFFIIFIFFSISKTKLPTYIFPSFVSLALITAVLWDDFLKERTPQKMKAMSISYYLLPVVMILGQIGALIFINFRYPAVLAGSFTASLFLIFGMALSLAAFINKKFIGSFLLLVYSVVIFLHPFDNLVLPEIERYETSKEISQRLSSVMKADERLGSESHYLAGLAFYTGKIPIDLDKHHILVRFLSSNERVWCVLKEKNHIQLYTLETKPYLKKPSYMVYKIGKRSIITNIVPDDGVFLIKRERLE